ncbi:MAG: hypothetical protein K1X44_04050 [Alphaproteobacteria bacterium]|nr:hypothetical protein [Alphaproteobacteria bacterium]
MTNLNTLAVYIDKYLQYQIFAIKNYPTEGIITIRSDDFTNSLSLIHSFSCEINQKITGGLRKVFVFDHQDYYVSIMRKRISIYRFRPDRQNLSYIDIKQFNHFYTGKYVASERQIKKLVNAKLEKDMTIHYENVKNPIHAIYALGLLYFAENDLDQYDKLWGSY